VLTPESLKGFDAEVAQRLGRALGLDVNPLRISIQDERSLARNQEIAAERLRERIVDALAPGRLPRRPTRRPRCSSGTRRGKDPTWVDQAAAALARARDRLILARCSGEGNKKNDAHARSVVVIWAVSIRAPTWRVRRAISPGPLRALARPAFAIRAVRGGRAGDRAAFCNVEQIDVLAGQRLQILGVNSQPRWGDLGLTTVGRAVAQVRARSGGWFDARRPDRI
jgi:hypothetical protein